MIDSQEVWIVQHDQSADNTILGVFSTQEEASDFAEEVEGEFPDGVIYARFEIGFRYNQGSRRSDFGPA